MMIGGLMGALPGFRGSEISKAVLEDDTSHQEAGLGLGQVQSEVLLLLGLRWQK